MRVTYARVGTDGVQQPATPTRTPEDLILRVTGGVPGLYILVHPGCGGPEKWVATLIQDLSKELEMLRHKTCSACYLFPGGCPGRSRTRIQNKLKPDCKQHLVFLEQCL